MKTILLFCFFSLGGLVFLQAQDRSEGTFALQVANGTILFDDDNDDIINDYALTLEGNYFVADNVTLTLGVDHIIDQNLTMIAFGSRIYVTEELFFRQRNAISIESRVVYDMLLGAGYDFWLNDTFAFTLNADYHVPARGLGLRFGVTAFF
jgi:hypothetical protein